jgi:hypothetical protein
MMILPIRVFAGMKGIIFVHLALTAKFELVR